MTEDMMFSRRLDQSEAMSWFDLEEIDSGCALSQENLAIADHFARLEDAVFYRFSVRDEPIGGTALFRDRNRCGIALVGMKMAPKYRANLSYNLIKSSLPFFRTASIQGIDAIVCSNDAESNIPFPYCTNLPSWTRNILERIEFKEISKVYSSSIFGFNKATLQEQESEVSPLNVEDVSSLIMKTDSLSQLECSQVWLGVCIAASNSALIGVFDEEELRGVYASGISTRAATFPMVRYEPTFTHEMAHALLEYACSNGCERIELPLVGNGQKDLIKALEQYSSSQATMHKAILLRRSL